MKLDLPTLAAAAVTGALAAVVATTVVGSAPTSGSVDGATLAALDLALSDLQSENAALRARLDELERPAELAPVTPPATEAVERSEAVAGVSRAEFEDLLERIEAFEARPLESPESLSAAKEDLKLALKEVRKEEAHDSVRQWETARRERLDDDVAKITERLALSPSQENEMRRALLAQYDRDQEVRQLWEQGVSDEILGETKQTNGETFATDLQGFLTEEQQTAFWEMAAAAGGK